MFHAIINEHASEETQTRFHAWELPLCLIIMAEMIPSLRQETGQSHYRYDSVKYDLKVGALYGQFKKHVNYIFPWVQIFLGLF